MPCLTSLLVVCGRCCNSSADSAMGFAVALEQALEASALADEPAPRAPVQGLNVWGSVDELGWLGNVKLENIWLGNVKLENIWPTSKVSTNHLARRTGESMQRPLELCNYEGLEALPPIGKEYQQSYKEGNDRLP
ncbi:hypothetical protein QJQ45_005701 [Haematococcus lacustris]|nr:hypothetical protein QJQ45_005701 [Haematococcus lacustris]